jgi:exopolysaccharide production protein ExoZ
MASEKLQGLQLARAMAALSVAYYHSYIALRAFPEAAQMPIAPLKQWGYLGVDFFFAISGYVICLVAAKPSFSPLPFAIKRVFRLYPIFWVAMACVAFLIAIGKYRLEPIGHFLYSMTLLPQQGAPAYDLSWTLEREMVFYALAACIVPLAGIRGLAIVMAALATAGWYFGNPWSFHLISTTQAQFLAGIVVFLLRARTKFLGAVVPLVAGTGLLVATHASGHVLAIPVSMGIILLGMTQLQLPWDRWPFRWMVAVGDASYSVYLLHYVVFVASVYLCVYLAPPNWSCEPWRFATLAVSAIISIQTWRWVELPMIRIGNALAAATARSRSRAMLKAPFAP